MNTIKIYSFQLDKKRLHEGVLMDKERQERKKVANLYQLEQQTKLNKILRKQENEDEELVLKLLENSKK